MAYTRRIEPAELDDLAGVEVTAHLFQRFVAPKAFEARVTVVGTRVFAAAIHACSPGRASGLARRLRRPGLYGDRAT